MGILKKELDARSTRSRNENAQNWRVRLKSEIVVKVLVCPFDEIKKSLERSVQSIMTAWGDFREHSYIAHPPTAPCGPAATEEVS